jgi:multimeric flavodoxin WrbA
MRKILAVVGSGIRGGNTDRLTDAFVRGTQEAGHEAKKIFLDEGDLHGCRGCGACQITGKCAIDDIMQTVFPIFHWCDTMVMASPLYFWTLSSQIKAFMDRLYAISHEDLYPPKDAMLLMTAGSNREDAFNYPVRYFKFITRELGGTAIGTYLADGCDGTPGRHTISEEHLKNAYVLGRNLGERGGE